MQRPGCPHENTAGQKFCGECGTPLRRPAESREPALSYADLQRTLTEALEQQTATSAILRVISNSPADYQPVFDTIVRTAGVLCGAVDAVLWTIDGDELVVRAHHGPLPGSIGARQPMHGSVAGYAVHTARPVHVEDLTEADDFPFGRDLARRLGWRTTLSAPLLREGVAIGAILIRRSEVHPFTDRQIALLQTFADQAVIAIENTRLFTELQDKNRALTEAHARVTEALEQQTATAEILRLISRSPGDMQAVFDELLEKAVRVCAADLGLLFRYENDTYRLGAFAGTRPEFVEFFSRGPFSPDPESGLGRIARTRRTVQIDDVTTEALYPRGDPLRRATADLEGIRTWLGVPMIRDGDLLGAIVIYRREVSPFADRQIGALQTFAEQAVIAIENARLLSELETRNLDLTESLERQTATAEILRVISEARGDVQPVFAAIARSALRLLRGFSVGVVRVVGDRLDPVAIEAGRPGSAAAVREAIAQLPRRRGAHLWDAIIDREVKQIQDVEAETIDEDQRTRARTRGWRASIAVPMLEDGQPIGVIAVSREEPGRFSLQQVDLLKAFADQAAIAVKNAGLLTDLHARTAELTRSVEQLTALGEVGQAVSSSLDLETVLTTIVARAVGLTGVDGGVVFEYDEAAEEFEQRASTGQEAPAEARRRARFRKGEGVVGRTAITHEPVQVADITRPGAYESPLRESLVESGVRALLAVPMLREGHLMGSLVVARNSPGEFPPETVDLLRTFATQSALAIQNARMYRELADQGRQLEVASRHKSEFLASMSHELRTPLNAILGFNEMILGDIYGEVPPELREPLTEMQNSGRHLLRLINNVLDLSKIEAGRMELSLSDYSVQDTVAQVRASLQSLAADKGLEFVTAVPADLPLAYGDAGRITQCLTNLAGNAIKFTRQGRVEIAAELQGDLLVYRVTDTGIGIGPDRIDTLFTEFRQADPTIASEFGGSGLGLSITRKFAEMHGGRVWVESEPGKGSTFFLALPLRVDGGATT
jgi:signal transduction histidine kinase